MTYPSESGGGPAATPTERPTVSTNHGTDEHGSIHTDFLTVEWHVIRAADVTLVTVHLTNTHDAARVVSLTNNLDGPVLPPCRHGVPEVGWDDDGLTRAVPSESRVSVGYACRAPPETPPVDVTDRPTEQTGDGDSTTPVDRALRSLGDHAPPRAVVADERTSPPADRQPVSESVAAASSPRETAQPSDSLRGVVEERERAGNAQRGDANENENGSENGNGNGHETETESTDTARGVNRAEPGDSGSTTVVDSPRVMASYGSSAEPVPAPVAAWFHAVEARLNTADRLAGDVAEATPAVASLGGRAGVEVLANTLETDAAALARVAARADELATRAEAADVPDLGGPR